MRKRLITYLSNARIIRSTPAIGAQSLRVDGAKRILAGCVFTVAMAVLAGRATAAGPAPVDLRSAAHFAILAGSAVTSTGGGTTRGDLGLSPTTGAAITGFLTNQVHGIIYAVDAGGPAGAVIAPELLTTAKVDLVAAFYDAAGRTNAAIVYPAGGNVGGMTLVPGLYQFASTAFVTGMDVTLTGGVDDVWIFQIGTSLTVGSGIHVVLTGAAQARNIFWQVGTSATLGSASGFKGTLMADQSITMDAGSTMEGRALALAAAVTFNGQSIGLPPPEAPRFTDIYRTGNATATVTLSTAPYFLLTLQACPDLLRAEWTTIATDTPAATPWTYTDTAATEAVPRRFYRAFITP